MMADSEIADLKLSIVQVHGKMDTMLEIIKAGDRESQTGVTLLAANLDNIAKQVEGSRHEVKDSFSRVYDRLETLNRDHVEDDFPHGNSPLIKDMREQIDILKTRANLAMGAVGFLMFIGLPGVYTILKAAGQ